LNNFVAVACRDKHVETYTYSAKLQTGQEVTCKVRLTCLSKLARVVEGPAAALSLPTVNLAMPIPAEK